MLTAPVMHEDRSLLSQVAANCGLGAFGRFDAQHLLGVDSASE